MPSSVPFETIIEAPANTIAAVRDGVEFRAQSFGVSAVDFSQSSSKASFLVIGYDTEFKTPPLALSRQEVAEGKGNYKVLSYQVHCKVYGGPAARSSEWSAICFADGDKRLTLGELLTFAIARGRSEGAIETAPRTIFLVGHFTRADMPALGDFAQVVDGMDNIRNTFVTFGNGLKVQYRFPDGDPVQLTVHVRDTMLLTPAASKSLEALGDLVGQSKISLGPDPATDLYYKENMDALLSDDPELFERYAINDAVICVKYMDRLIGLCKSLLGPTADVPLTLSGMGMNLLLNDWQAKHGSKGYQSLLGKEEVLQKTYNKKTGRYTQKLEWRSVEKAHLHAPLATECYHGGRNEQFWFGPSHESIWTDYDLSGAYPTAMANIRTPDWQGMRLCADVRAFQPGVLGMALVEFAFPPTVRLPTLPVRTDNGLVFPRSGRSYCGAPEIAVAVALGATVKIEYGVIVPYKDDTRIFGEFIAGCVKKRQSYAKGSLDNLFWKELSNSTYGKTAQGLRDKRVYNLRARATEDLGPSKITNAYFATYITSFVRAVLGEIMNKLPTTVTVFSCTTDGFLSTASEAEMESALSGPLCQLFSSSRHSLTGKRDVVEIKHVCRRVLGWKTRGQATLKKGSNIPFGAGPTVLAKGGIRTHADKNVDQQNAEIVELFLKRTPDMMVMIEPLTGMRDIVELGNDLVRKLITRRLNMEYDWKRRPVSASMSVAPSHLAFATEPWDTVEQFTTVRDQWDNYNDGRHHCLKTVEDFEGFGRHLLSKTSLSRADSRYLKKLNPDISRLRQSLCSAWHISAAGLIKGGSASDFAAVLKAAGIPCKVTDVENGKKKPFEPHRSPETPPVVDALKLLQLAIPGLRSDVLLASRSNGIDILQAVDRRNPFDCSLAA